jgi:adenylate cyclase, class 2
MHDNIEIKARSNDHDCIRSMLQNSGADFKGTDHQIDTYYHARNGRFKMRRGNIENVLVFYERDDKAGPKHSKVMLYHDPQPGLDMMLEKANGIMVRVDKNREIYFIENVKFHLDTVVGLGTFVEIEAIDLTGSLGKEKLHQQCTHYMRLFGIRDEDLITKSYSDLLQNL